MTAARCSEARGVPGGRIVEEARRWIGTPYVHQASCRGAGADCLGLVRGVWRALVGPEPEAPGPYTADWAEASGEERLLEAAHRHLLRVDRAKAKCGDVLVFRMRTSGVAKHLGLLSSPCLLPGRMIHAYSGHAVMESSLTEAWLRRVAGVYRFPTEAD